MALLSFIKVTFRIVPSAKGGEDKLTLLGAESYFNTQPFAKVPRWLSCKVKTFNKTD